MSLYDSNDKPTSVVTSSNKAQAPINTDIMKLVISLIVGFGILGGIFWFAVTFVMPLVTPQELTVQFQDVEVRAGSTYPNQTYTTKLLVDVQNLSPDPMTGVVITALPVDGGNVLMRITTFDIPILGPNEKRKIAFSVYINPQALSGTYTVNVNVTSASQTFDTRSATLSVLSREA